MQIFLTITAIALWILTDIYLAIKVQKLKRSEFKPWQKFIFIAGNIVMCIVSVYMFYILFW